MCYTASVGENITKQMFSPHLHSLLLTPFLFTFHPHHLSPSTHLCLLCCLGSCMSPRSSPTHTSSSPPWSVPQRINLPLLYPCLPIRASIVVNQQQRRSEQGESLGKAAVVVVEGELYSCLSTTDSSPRKTQT